MNDLIRYIKKKAMRALLTPFKVLPVMKNRVMIINDLGRNYSCNPKAITEYLINNYKGEVEIVYAVDDIKKRSYLTEKGICIVNFNSLNYFYYALTSKVLITNSGGLSYIPIRKKQYVINTHHGGGAYKTAGIDMFEDSLFFRKDMMLSSKQTNVFLSTNRTFTEVMSKACLIPKEVFWEIGMPRNDRLINCKEDPNIIKRKVGLMQDQKMVLYAPTYRKPDDNYYKGSVAVDYHIDSKMVCEALSERFGGEWVFAYRLHPCVENKGDYIIEEALDLSDYEDMQDLLLISDVLINDFSSSFWDFLLTGRPCFLYAQDLDHYVENTKVYTPVEEWPFPKARSNKELQNNILSFDEEDYKKRCTKHYNDLGGCETGIATELVCKRIMDICS